MTASHHAMTPEAVTALQALNQTRWWDRAACAGAPFAIFDCEAERVGRRGNGARYDAARAICAGCLVVDACRQDADLLPDPSFRAGFTAAERRSQNRGAA